MLLFFLTLEESADVTNLLLGSPTAMPLPLDNHKDERDDASSADARHNIGHNHQGRLVVSTLYVCTVIVIPCKDGK